MGQVPVCFFSKRKLSWAWQWFRKGWSQGSVAGRIWLEQSVFVVETGKLLSTLGIILYFMERRQTLKVRMTPKSIPGPIFISVNEEDGRTCHVHRQMALERKTSWRNLRSSDRVLTTDFPDQTVVMTLVISHLLLFRYMSFTSRERSEIGSCPSPFLFFRPLSWPLHLEVNNSPSSK